MSRYLTWLLGLLLVGISFLGCGSSRRSAPLLPGEREITDPTLLLGRRIFDAHCHQCHPGGTEGLGFALNNKPLPGFLVRFQVRNGLGVMPAFSEETISEEELDALVAYVDWRSDLPTPEEVP